MKRSLHIILFLLLGLPVFYLAILAIQQRASRAASVPANFTIDTRQTEGRDLRKLTSFAQGGEEPPPMISAAVPMVRPLRPEYIRIDHIFDYYDLVKKTDNGFTYDFSKLDKTVDDILETGAKPFFSLSYMPAAFTSSGSVIEKPKDWNDWRRLVAATISHFSGRNNRNLKDIYYEVWNEPELYQFGSWQTSGSKDYRLLYRYAAEGAQDTTNTNPFFLGGPAMGSYYPEFLRQFVSFIEQNNLRLDFISWHRYHTSPSMFNKDADQIRTILSGTKYHGNTPVILSEWGINSENLPVHNTDMSAAFTASAIIQFNQNIYSAYSFEVKDGPPPQGGMWGILTHEKNSNPLSPKPKYHVFNILSRIRGTRLKMSGDGTYVSGLASRSQNTIRVLLSNYDPDARNTENVPVTFLNLPPSSYKLTYTYILTKETGSSEIVATNGLLTRSFPMLPNSILLLELTPTGELASFIPGYTSTEGDYGLVLSHISPIKTGAPDFVAQSTGKILFNLKPMWESDDKQTETIFDIGFTDKEGNRKRLFLNKHYRADGNILLFGIAGDTQEGGVEIPIQDWTNDHWYTIEAGWDPQYLRLTINGITSIRQARIPQEMRDSSFTLYPSEIAIDNLTVEQGPSKFTRQFNGQTDK